MERGKTGKAPEGARRDASEQALPVKYRGFEELIATLRAEVERSGGLVDLETMLQAAMSAPHEAPGRSSPRKRRRLQIEIRPGDEATVARLIEGFGTNESDAGRQMLQIYSRLIDLIQRGFVITARPATDENAVDALPDLTRAIRGDVYDYRHLVELPHPWRRQLYFKGRRLTVSQVVEQMRANKWSIDQTADEFDLSPAAVAEAVQYASRNEALLREEAAEERRRAQLGVTQRAAAAG